MELYFQLINLQPDQRRDEREAGQDSKHKMVKQKKAELEGTRTFSEDQVERERSGCE